VAASTSLTSRYLAEVTARGMPHNRLIDVAREQIDLAATSYDGSCLTRPVFLAHAEFAELRDDLLALHAMLACLPGRLFGGDVTAFAQAVGMTGLQLTAVDLAGGQPPTRLGRADLFRDATAFRVMELNLGSALGGLDNALLNRAFLTEPAVAEFVAAHGLSYTDTMGVLAATVRAECGIGEGEQPLIAVADWPDSFGILHRQLRAGAGQLARYWPARCCAPPGGVRCGCTHRWMPRSTAARAPSRCCRMRQTGTCSPPPNWPGWTGCCRGPGWYGPGRSPPTAARWIWPATRGPSASTWCSSRPRCTPAPG